MYLLFFGPQQEEESGEGILPVIPNLTLDWIRNQVHYITGDDPDTSTLEGTLNLLAEKLLQNDRALLDYLVLIASSVSSLQKILNVISPGKSRIHADNTFSNYHQDVDFDFDLRHNDRLIYSDTWVVGSHQDEKYIENHSDTNYHQDVTIIHNDEHGDHSDHYDQEHGDRGFLYSDHSDHSDFSHSDRHGDFVVHHSDSYNDHTDIIYHDQTTDHVDSHYNYADHGNRAHEDIPHVNHEDTQHLDQDHANLPHFDEDNHANYSDHSNFTDFRDYVDHSDHEDHDDHRDYTVYHSDIEEFSDHVNYEDHANVWR
jgi:hypothetical protein